MPDSGDAVLLSTTTPEFLDGGDHLLCRLTSGGKVWSFGIKWSDTEAAMLRCGAVLEAHRARVVPLARAAPR